MIRFIILLILVIVYLTITLPLALVAWIISLFNERLSMKIGRGVSKVGFTIAKFMSGADVTYLHDERVPEEKSVLYIGNHRSFFDIMLFQIHCRDFLGFVAKKELRWVPSLNIWMHFIRCGFIDRKDVKQSFAVLTKMCEDVVSGKSSMMLFPEGTRNRGEEGSLLKFHEASMKMAAKAGCTIVPVAISNTINVFEAHFPALKPTKVVIEYGEPIDPTTLSRADLKDLGTTVRDRMLEMLKSHEGMY